MIRYKKVCPEDYNGEQLQQLARDGVLCIDMTKLVNLDEVIKNAREYVRRVRSFVKPQFRSSVDALWEDIFQCKELNELILPNSNCNLLIIRHLQFEGRNRVESF